MANNRLDSMKVGLTLGTLIGGVHLLWSLMVALDWARPLMDFIFRLHFLSNPYALQDFDLATAAMLVLVTFVVGYVVGWVLSTLWNKFGAK